MDIQAFFQEHGFCLAILALLLVTVLRFWRAAKTWGRPREDQPEDEQEIERRGIWVLWVLCTLFLLMLVGGIYFF